MGVAFFGYVLPWGQMSFWGAAVITNFFRVIPFIGRKMVIWVWGDLIVRKTTLKFFYTLHFIVPLLARLVILVHLMFLHIFGSSRGDMKFSNQERKILFFPNFFSKDSLIFVVFIFWLFISGIYFLMEEENFVVVDIVSSPIHIKPE